MELNQLSKHVSYMVHDAETDRPALGYVQGANKAFMMDAGNSAKHYAMFTEKLLENGLPLPDFVAVTHSHWDHSYGLSASLATTIAGKSTNAILSQMQAWEWTELAMQQRLQTGEESLFCHEHILKEYEDITQIQVRTAEVSFTGEMEIDLGGVHVVLQEIVSPHTPDSVVFFVPEDGVLFLGDSYCSVYTDGEWVYEKDLLGTYIEQLRQIPFAIAIKGHHAPQSKEALLAELLGEWERL